MDKLSVGLGANIFIFTGLLGKGHVEQRFIAAPGSGFQPGTELELNGKGTTAGLNVTFLYTPWRTEEGKPRFPIAGIWSSQAVLPLNGDLPANGVRLAGASTSVRLQEVWIGGIAYWPERNHEKE